MEAIVNRLRKDIGNPPVGVFSDDDLEAILDARAIPAAAVLLTADTVLSGSPTVFRYPGFWETTAVVHTASGTVLDPDGDLTSLLRGVWAFAAAPGEDVYVTGTLFDYWAAAADALEAWAARVAVEFDFVTDGQQFERSQKREGLLQVAREYGRRALVRV